MAYWIVKKDYTGNIRCTCSECKYTYVGAGEYYDYLYNSLICPNCKAKLTDKTEEDYYEFFKRFNMDLEYWVESKNIKLG